MIYTLTGLQVNFQTERICRIDAFYLKYFEYSLKSFFILVLDGYIDICIDAYKVITYKQSLLKDPAAKPPNFSDRGSVGDLQQPRLLLGQRLNHQNLEN